MGGLSPGYLPAAARCRCVLFPDSKPGLLPASCRADRCRCPSNFSPREMGQSKGCACDCFDRQQDCLRYKKGKAYFSWEDRL